MERAFGEIKERSEKDPRLAGAYVGRSPSEKPANYGESAVPMDLFKTVLAEAVEHYNTRTDRRSNVAYKTSHEAVFKAGLESTKVRRLTDEQRRYFFHVAERRKLTPDGSVRLGKAPRVNRYWSKALGDFAGQDVIVRYDPGDLTAPVLVETSEGKLIDAAVPILEKRGFNSTSHAREHARAERAFKKRTRQSVADLKRLADLENAGDMLGPETSSIPAAPVVAPDFQRKPSRAPVGGSFDPRAVEKAVAILEHRAAYG